MNLASNFSTWKGNSTKGSREPDPLEDALSDLVKAAQQDLDEASRMEVGESDDRGELVERADSVSFILLAPGYCLKDFKVRVSGDELRVDAPDFEITRTLGSRVEGPRAKAEYRNGVFSLRMPKKI